VRRDEEAARAQERDDELMMAAADRAERLALLRRRRDAAAGAAPAAPHTPPAKHINFWEDLEDKHTPARTDPTEPHLFGERVELAPWYTQADKRAGHEQRVSAQAAEAACRRDAERKASSDPLVAVHAFLEQKRAAHADAKAPDSAQGNGHDVREWQHQRDRRHNHHRTDRCHEDHAQRALRHEKHRARRALRHAERSKRKDTFFRSERSA